MPREHGMRRQRKRGAAAPLSLPPGATTPVAVPKGRTRMLTCICKRLCKNLLSAIAARFSFSSRSLCLNKELVQLFVQAEEWIWT